jgi:ParB family chromosome partitioning protein
MARAGAFVSIDRNGRLLVEHGYIRPEDEPPAQEEGGGDAETVAAPGDQTAESADAVEAPRAPSASRVIVHVDGRPVVPEHEPISEDDAEGVIRPLSDRLVSELTARRTLAPRDAVARNPRIAESLLLHKVVPDAFHPTWIATHCLEASRVLSVSGG